MRAWRVIRPGPVRGALALREVPDPVPGPDELLVRVLACGVCRTDLHVTEGDLPVRRAGVVPEPLDAAILFAPVGELVPVAMAFLDHAGRHRLRVSVMPYPLEAADQALVDLEADAITGAGVLVVSPR